jgi:hypothetical protein
MEHNPTQHGNGKPSTALELKIIFDTATGNIGVNIPEALLGHHVLCYGLLEAARQTIQKYAEQKASGQRIMVASAVPPPPRVA